MPVRLEDRPIEDVRTEVIDQLIMNYGHGVITYEAFERRLDQAMECKQHQPLVELVADLELSVDDAYVTSKKQNLGYKLSSGQAKKTESIVSIFSGSDYNGSWYVPKVINLTSICSGSTLDFTDAIFTHQHVTIKVFSLMSGEDIYVPENINVTTNLFSVFSGNTNTAPSTCDPEAPTIHIEGVSIFSGLDIKLKRSLKERFISFADSLKKMF